MAGICIKIIFFEAKNNNAPNTTKRINIKWIINIKFAVISYIVSFKITKNHDP